MKAMPAIEKFMTPMPHTIGPDIPIKRAMTMMKDLRVRHLPVQEAGRIVGILSDRDVKLSASFKGGEDLPVQEVMTQDPYCVDPDLPLDQAVREMADQKYGSVIVQRAGKIVGIFTSTDALRVLADVLEIAREEPGPSAHASGQA